ncbi:response regulator [Aliamphritea spongicola]|uniref:response regulator n=1 Tax=Aliamphritea spongicola TaxID=707589 RepID=UPI00196AD791|nr:response regulator [Aliamphritea spongicola]MBN3563715.1 response regulator [Aliamphritea spongicola]
MTDIRVIIAEDDRQIAAIQQRFLERIEGFELVGMAHGLEEAEDLVEIMQPDLILLDVQFPTGTGLDLLRKLRAENSSVDVILVTAAKEVDTLREALHGGVFDFILKPLVFERLQETLHNYRQHLSKLQALQSLDQQNVDTMLPRGQTPKTTSQPQRLPKGIDSITLDKIRQVLQDKDVALNASEVGDYINASRTTARRYLEYMVSSDELHAEVSYGSVGRPERKYRLNP